MTNRNTESRYERPEQSIPFAIEQWVRQHVHTSLPGIVREYDAATKRARVQPAINRLVLNDGAEQPESMERPIIINVPLQQVSTGSHMLHHQVDVGDVVLLVFTERGIERFKAQWGQASDPTMDGFYSERDAMAVPWGVETIAPVRETGIVMQNADGSTNLQLDSGTIKLVVGDSSITITNGEIVIRSAQVTIQANRIDDEGL